MKDLETRRRAREWFHGLTAPPGSWIVIRVDGRSVSRFTEERFGKPFDERFSTLMTTTAEALLTESAAVAPATFTHAAGEPACFDSRLWLGNDTTDVLGHFSWRQADAARCALNGWCHEVPSWQRRGVGLSWETVARPGFDPVRRTEVTATRRRVLVDRDLPMKDEYRDHVRRLL